MSDAKTVAEFNFVVNKSFLSYRMITVPSRFYQSLKENGVLERRPALIEFRGGARMSGSIHTGWRAGGQYYQIKLPAAQAVIGDVRIGTTLRIRMLKSGEEWLIDLK